MPLDLEKFKNILGLLVSPDTSVGVHGISKECTKELFDEIMMNGLNVNGWGGVLSTCVMFGPCDEMQDYDFDRLLNYVYSVDNNGNCANVIVGIPSSFKDKDNNQYFGGIFKAQVKTDFYAKGRDEYGANLPINNYIEQLKKIPSEFIVGVLFYNSNDKQLYFYINKNYIDYKGPTFKKEFFEKNKDMLLGNNVLNLDDIDHYFEIAKRFNIDEGLFVEQLRKIKKDSKRK